MISFESKMDKKGLFIFVLGMMKCIVIPSWKCANEFPNRIQFYRELAAEFSKKGMYIDLYQLAFLSKISKISEF